MATGDYKQALGKYQQLLKEDPQITDVALFQMGLIYAHPKNPDKDYKKSLQYFKRVIKEFPENNLKLQAQTYASLLNQIMEQNIKNGKQRAEIISLIEKCTILKKDNQEKDKRSNELQHQIEKLKEIDLNIQRKKRAVNHK
ncbi:MAG: tetratricopeptide repeat protein [Proteobacteria bacterium]|nr:tetratricopeptide repeat protein [Pseudomonadota bacterium]